MYFNISMTNQIEKVVDYKFQYLTTLDINKAIDLFIYIYRYIYIYIYIYIFYY